MTTEANGSADRLEPATTRETMISREVYLEQMLAESLAGQGHLRGQCMRLAQENHDLRGEIEGVRAEITAIRAEVEAVRGESDSPEGDEG